jgi:hypothetical protein
VLESVVFLAVFVDNIMLASRLYAAITNVKQLFQSEFTMTDAGLVQELLGVRITQRPGELILDQVHYCRSIARDFGRYIGSMQKDLIEIQTLLTLYSVGCQST